MCHVWESHLDVETYMNVHVVVMHCINVLGEGGGGGSVMWVACHGMCGMLAWHTYVVPCR